MRTAICWGVMAFCVLVVLALGGPFRTAATAVAQGTKLPEGHRTVPIKDSDELKKDMKAVQGTWKLIYAEYKGKPWSAEELAITLVMSGDKCTVFKKEDKIHEHGDFKLDPTKKPKAIDISEDEGPLKDGSNRGIYLLEDDLFILCYNEPSMDRPTHFTSSPTASLYLFICKRVRP